MLPVHEADALRADELVGRLITAYNLFGIQAIAQDRGISFEPGVEVGDQALVALNVLFNRRFPLAPTAD